MRVLVAAVLFSAQQSGVQRHGFGLVRSLLTRKEICSITIFIGPWQKELFEAADFMEDARVVLSIADTGSSTFERNRWYYSELPLLAHGLQIDIVHLICPSPVKSRAFSCPLVVTLHDLYPYQIPSNFGRLKGFFNQHLLQHCLGHADAITCVSDVTFLALGQYVPNSVRQRALRIYNCVESCGESKCELGPGGGAESLRRYPFLLCVAQHRANKNILFLLQTFELLVRTGMIGSATRLAIIGIDGPETPRILAAIKSSGLEQGVMLLHGLSDADMNWCYRNCICLAAPSLLEGFGLPIVEALQAGSRVVCSDIPAFREVGAGHCTYVPIHRAAPLAFAQAIVEALRLPPQRCIDMPWFSRAAIAEEYLKLYRRLLHTGSSARKFTLPAWLYRDSLGEIAERKTL